MILQMVRAGRNGKAGWWWGASDKPSDGERGGGVGKEMKGKVEKMWGAPAYLDLWRG